MTPVVASVTYILAALSVALDVAIVIVIISIILRHGAGKPVFLFIARHGVLIAFIAAFASLGGSLFYSEFAGFVPCTLCWIQRVCMYPQIVLLGFTLRRYDAKLVLSSLILSGLGALVAGYNQYLQFGGNPLVPCGTGPGTVSCAQRFFVEFGYMTIPMMSLTAFALIGVALVAERIHRG